MQMSTCGINNSLVGKALGDDEVETYIDTYASSLTKLVQRHKSLRQAANQRMSGQYEQVLPVGNINNQIYQGNL